jgi:predicted ABC-type ATPase
MSEPPRGRSRSREGKTPTPYNEGELKSLKKADLIKRCEDGGIDITDVKLKQDIIARMLGNTSHSGEASARAASATAAASARSVSPSHHFTATASAKRSPPKRPEMVGDDPQTPTTPESNLRVEEFGRKGAVWFRPDFLEAALKDRLDQSKDVGRANPSPTLFILVGPASVGKSSAKRLIPEMTDYVVNVDVDEIKLYGNDVLPRHPNPKKPGEMLSDVEGIQFKYDLVLEKLRPMVFKNATMFGEGQYKNIILDTTGSMSDQIKMYIRTAKQTYNYTVKVIIVYSEKTQCLERVQSRNRELFRTGKGTRYIPPRVVNSIYDTFLKKNQAYFYAIGPRMTALTDELILVDNRAQPRIVAIRQPSAGLDIFPDDEHTLVGVDGAFYGLTLNPAQAGQPASIVQGNIHTAIEKAKREWADFEAVAAKAKHGGHGGSSRKRRISRRRIHGSRAIKTIKKYSRPVTRRRRRHCRH